MVTHLLTEKPICKLKDKLTMRLIAIRTYTQTYRNTDLCINL